MAVEAVVVDAVQRRIAALWPHLSERQRRLLLGAEARKLGWGGVSAVARAGGVSRSTVTVALAEVECPPELAEGRSRRVGGGRKIAVEKDPGLASALDVLVDPETRGDPESPVRWTCESTRRLAAALLHQTGCGLQANAKTREGRQHPDRDGQFRHLNAPVRRFLRPADPVISVDTKKKELVGEDPGYKNNGREYQPKGQPVRVGMHDLPDPKVPKAVPHGIYDLAANTGWVSVGCDGDTAAFAVETLRRWWAKVGSPTYPKARRLLVCADAGGSNGYRIRLWKLELARLATEIGLPITVCHFPPGTSKWDKFEHRLFSAITGNWRGQPLTSHEVVVGLISSNSATIVHRDADLERAASAIVRGGYGYAGQICISVQQVLVHESVSEQFLGILAAKFREIIVGDPSADETDVGPMISEDQAKRAEAWIKEAVQQGARLVVGGERNGPFLMPAVLADVRPEMKVVCMGAFAPLLAVEAYRTLDEAIASANEMMYGLQTGIFTSSIDTAMYLARRIEVGGVIINDTSNYRVDQMPNGGVKNSRMGLEGVRSAIEELTDPKLIALNLGKPE